MEGERGPPGNDSDIMTDGYLLTRHSQTTEIPTCPTGTKMWEGYSILYLEGNERAHGQDLSKLFTCLKSKVCRNNLFDEIYFYFYSILKVVLLICACVSRHPRLVLATFQHSAVPLLRFQQRVSLCQS